MKKSVAQPISYISHPPIVAIVSFIFLIYVLNPSQKYFLVGITCLFSGFLPLAFIYFFPKRGFANSIHLDKKDRIKPFAGSIISYVIGFLVLYTLKSPKILTAYMFCYFSNTAIMAGINTHWKISIHASGIAGPITVILYQLKQIFPLVLFIIVIPVCWSRFVLKAHTKMQITGGAVITIVITWIQLTILLSVL